MTDSATTPWTPRYATRAGRMAASEIRDLLKLLEEPGVISFAGGIPDPALFPTEAFAAAYAEALSTPAKAATFLQYSVSEGYGDLTGWIAAYMQRQGIPAARENIVITCGSQQALDFLGKLLLDPGDTALVARPTYLGALQAFSTYEPRYDTLGDNRTPESFRTAAEAAGGTVKFAYVVPDFDNPTGKTMPAPERERLLDLADELDIVLLEDAAYRDIRFEGDRVPALQARDVARKGSLDASRVAYLGTFSKTVAPGLRLGWVCAARPIVDKLVQITQASDLNVSALNQRAMFALAESRFDGLVASAIAHYSAKRDAMLRALEAHMPEGVQWHRPEGGLFLWLTLPERISAKVLLERAVREARVAFVPGGAFFHDGSGANTLRLSYSLPSHDEIEEGIRRLAQIIADAPA